jgi:hypothetical protein
MASRLVLLLSGFALAAGACSSEVLIARNDRSEGGAGGSSGMPSSGTGGATCAASGGRAESGSGGGGSGAMVPVGGDSSEAAPRLLADSVMDFSLEQQGKYGWLYGYDDGSLDNFQLLPSTGTIRRYAPPSMDTWQCWNINEKQWTQIFQLGAHPNGSKTTPPSTPGLQRAVRRWKSTYAGPVIITGEIAKIDVDTTAAASNGVVASVYVDGKQLYSTAIARDDGGGRIYQVTPNPTLEMGSYVDFVLDPDGADSNDLTRFTAVIARAPTE